MRADTEIRHQMTVVIYWRRVINLRQTNIPGETTADKIYAGKIVLEAGRYTGSKTSNKKKGPDGDAGLYANTSINSRGIKM